MIELSVEKDLLQYLGMLLRLAGFPTGLQSVIEEIQILEDCED